MNPTKYKSITENMNFRRFTSKMCTHLSDNPFFLFKCSVYNLQLLLGLISWTARITILFKWLIPGRNPFVMNSDSVEQQSWDDIFPQAIQHLNIPVTITDWFYKFPTGYPSTQISTQIKHRLFNLILCKLINTTVSIQIFNVDIVRFFIHIQICPQYINNLTAYRDRVVWSVTYSKYII